MLLQNIILLLYFIIMDNDIKKIHDEIKSDKSITQYDNETIKYLVKPIGKAMLKNKGRPIKDEKDKCNYKDKILCDICGKEYVRSNSTNHKKTNYHKIHLELNKKLINILLK